MDQKMYAEKTVLEMSAKASHELSNEKKKRPGVNADLNETQKRLLNELFMKFDDIMSQSQFDVGLAKDVEHHIETGDAPPAKEHPRRINPIEAEELMKQVKVLMKLGFVRESNSPWAAPVVLVRKEGRNNPVLYRSSWPEQSHKERQYAVAQSG